MAREKNLNGNKVQPYQQLELFVQEEKDIRKTKPAKEEARKNPSTVKDVQEKTRQKTAREERKKAREESLRWIKALNAELDEVIKQSGKSSDDILSEILGEALYDPAHQKLSFKQAGKKKISPAPTMKKRVILKSQEEFVPEQENQSQKKQNPQVKVTFFPEKDNLILKLVKNGTNSPLADLYLHRQALNLLFSPGFEVLLSVKAARNIQLLDYQLATVHHVLKYLRGRALLCDEVGLGKTIEAGLIIMEYLLRGLVRRVLVLTPPSLVEQWRLEMQTKFNLDFVPYDAPLFKSTPLPWANFPYIIASLDTAKREPHRNMVLEQVYDLVIVDEAHHLKKQKTQAYQLVSQLKKKYMLLLTATPVENDLEELFNLITLLQPGQLETASSFKRKYITKGDPLKPKNVEELKKLVREVMVRNRRSETGVITAKRYAEVVEVALSQEEAAFYQRLTSFIRGHYIQEKGEISGAVNQFVLKTLQREVGSSIEAVLPTLEKMAFGENYPLSLRHVFHSLAEQAKRVSCRAKAEVLVSLLKKIPAKAVVFTCFVETMHFLAALLEKEGFRVARLAGGMRRAEKEAQVLAFADKAQVLVSTETGSEGRNLQFCNVIINFDLPWNPMRIEQRIGRFHRLGQTRDVYIYNLSAAETVEAHILELLDTKINMFQLVIGELDLILGNLQEKRDFEDIIMDIWARAADEASLHARLEDLGERLSAAKKQYLAVKEIDERLLGELLPVKD
jgi:SNF2 family DNA or RNA helicase